MHCDCAATTVLDVQEDRVALQSELSGRLFVYFGALQHPVPEALLFGHKVKAVRTSEQILQALATRYRAVQYDIRRTVRSTKHDAQSGSTPVWTP